MKPTSSSFKITNKAILFFILAVAAALRLYNLNELPFTHDEFSALFRTRYDSLSDLIRHGVMKLDTHPAGIQIFMYFWVKLFGESEPVVKLPFIIMGLASVYLVFLIGKKHLNESAGLFAAALTAGLQYTTHYSQIARPYISGLFFCLLMVYFWSHLILLPRKKEYKNHVLFILSATLCAYNHHFSLLFAGIVGITGLFLLKRKYLIRYIISCAIIFVLYLPHIKIFFYQLNKGGVGGWLGKPENDFIIEYLRYIFHFDPVLMVFVLALIAYGLHKSHYTLSISRRMLIVFALWFLLPFLIGFFYSKYVNAVLQYSVLIFSHSFLFYLLFSGIPSFKPAKNALIVTLLLAVTVTGLIFKREHYELFYESPYRALLIDHDQSRNTHRDIVSLVQTHERITDYYQNRLNTDTSYIPVNRFKNEHELRIFLQEQKSEYLFLGALPTIKANFHPIIRQYYPEKIGQTNYALGTSRLFKRGGKDNSYKVYTQHFSGGEFKNSENILPENITDTNNNTYYHITPDIEWGPSFSMLLADIITHRNNFIDVSVTFKFKEQPANPVIVSVLNSKGKNIRWSGTQVADYFPDQSDSTTSITVHHSLKLSDIYLNYRDIEFKTYVWNHKKESFLIDRIEVKRRDGNPKLYGLKRQLLE